MAMCKSIIKSGTAARVPPQPSRQRDHSSGVGRDTLEGEIARSVKGGGWGERSTWHDQHFPFVQHHWNIRVPPSLPPSPFLFSQSPYKSYSLSRQEAGQSEVRARLWGSARTDLRTFCVGLERSAFPWGAKNPAGLDRFLN